MLGYAGEQQSNQGLENLQAAHVRIIPENECETAFPGSTALDLFCGGDRTRRSNFCSGDQVIIIALWFICAVILLS